MAITAGFTKDFLEKWHKETSHLMVPYNKIVPVKKGTNVKELTLQDLDDGIIITMPDNSRYKLQRTNFTIDISEWSDVFNKLKITLEGCPQPIIKQPTQPKAEQEKNMSELFGKKYKVTTETSKLLLFAIEEAGGDIRGIPTSASYLYVYEDGSVAHSPGTNADFFNQHRFPEGLLEVVSHVKLRAVIHPKSPEQLAYEQLQAQIADEETRHNESMKALREQAEKLKPKQ